MCMATYKSCGNKITAIIIRGAGDGLFDGSLLEEISRDRNNHGIINSFAHIGVLDEIFPFIHRGNVETNETPLWNEFCLNSVMLLLIDSKHAVH